MEVEEEEEEDEKKDDDDTESATAAAADSDGDAGMDDDQASTPVEFFAEARARGEGVPLEGDEEAKGEPEEERGEPPGSGDEAAEEGGGGEEEEKKEEEERNDNEEEKWAAAAAVFGGVDNARAVDGLLQRVEEMYETWCPPLTTYAASAADDPIEGMVQHFRQLYCAGVDRHTPMDVAAFNEQYSAFMRDALVLKQGLRGQGLLRVSENAPADDLQLQINQQCVAKIEGIIEAIWTSNQWLRCVERQTHFRDDVSRLVFAEARDHDIRFTPFDEDELQDLDKLAFWILQNCRMCGYRKKGRWLYKQYMTKDRFGTHAWTKDIELQDFIWKCVSPKETNWKHYLQLISRDGADKRIANHLASIHDRDLPFLEDMRGWWSFPNGLFYCGDLRAHNRKKREGKSGGQMTEGLPAPELPATNMRWGHEHGDGPRFYRFLRAGEKLPDPCPAELGDAAMVPADVIAINYIPVPFEFEKYQAEMAAYKEKWIVEHKDELDEWAKTHTRDGVLTEQHPRIAHDGFHMGIRTDEAQGIIRHQFELRESDRAEIRTQVDSDYKGKDITDKEIIRVAAERAIVTREREVEHIYEVHYLCFGRLLYPVDAWRFQPFFLGHSGTGKSTLLRAIQELYPGRYVTLLANRVEKNFSIQDMVINESLLWLAMDVAADFQLDQMQWHSMVTGEGVNSSIKNGTAISIQQFEIPGAMAGNVLPNFKDNGGAASSRMAVAEYRRPVKGSNTQLLASIKQKHPALLYKAVKARHYFMKRYAGILPYDEKRGWLGKYFKRTKGIIGQESNMMEAFLARSDLVHVGEGFYCGVADFQIPWKVFCDQNKNKQNQVIKEWDAPVHFNILVQHDVQKVKGLCLESGLDSGKYFGKEEWVLMGVALSVTLPPVNAAKAPAAPRRRTKRTTATPYHSNRSSSSLMGPPTMAPTQVMPMDNNRIIPMTFRGRPAGLTVPSAQ